MAGVGLSGRHHGLYRPSCTAPQSSCTISTCRVSPIDTARRGQVSGRSSFDPEYIADTQTKPSQW